MMQANETAGHFKMIKSGIVSPPDSAGQVQEEETPGRRKIEVLITNTSDDLPTTVVKGYQVRE
jgi:hypothetical protein